MKDKMPYTKPLKGEIFKLLPKVKWFDPDWWDGDQSTRWKNALKHIVSNFERLNGEECSNHCGRCIKCIAEDALCDPQNQKSKLQMEREHYNSESERLKRQVVDKTPY